MRIIQLPIFSALVNDLLSELDYWELQDAVAANPALGDLIPGGAGLRKLRWRARSSGKGKSGGVRVIYYWRRKPDTIYFVSIFAKSRKENLSKAQLKILAEFVRENLK